MFCCTFSSFLLYLQAQLTSHFLKLQFSSTELLDFLFQFGEVIMTDPSRYAAAAAGSSIKPPPPPPGWVAGAYPQYPPPGGYQLYPPGVYYGGNPPVALSSHPSYLLTNTQLHQVFMEGIHL